MIVFLRRRRYNGQKGREGECLDARKWNDSVLRCPLCGGTFRQENGALQCARGHSFDLAREGYVNLLCGSKSGDKTGDDKYAARSRRDFLNKGYYAPLRDALCALFDGKSGTVLDICCGEGYYTDALARMEGMEVYGFDLSREMVRLAAKRGHARCFVANMAHIPVADASFDHAVHLFAPFKETEFVRVLRNGGTLYSVIPGRAHLYGLKQAVYDTAYYNDEQLPHTERLRLLGVERVAAQIELDDASDIYSMFRMTPYYFHTAQADREKLHACSHLSTQIEFLIASYEKTGE